MKSERRPGKVFELFNCHDCNVTSTGFVLGKNLTVQKMVRIRAEEDTRCKTWCRKKIMQTERITENIPRYDFSV